VQAKKYVIAVKHDRAASVSPDWLARLGNISGVSVEGGFGRRAQFLADAEAIERVRQEFTDDFLIEEASERSPM